jgi:ubiquinone/menaquinone biosynthesis C-methylase UbiE
MRAKTISKVFFDSPLAGLMANRMQKNRDGEAEAIDELAPSADDHVLAIGFGPGIGIELLAPRVRKVSGADLSERMLRIASRRNASAISSGRVELVQAAADSLPWDDVTFDGVVTVNTIQLWDPFEESVSEVARVMKPGARLVSYTHDWAIERFSGTKVDDWAAKTAAICERYGLTDAKRWFGRAEDGKIVAFVVRKG